MNSFWNDRQRRQRDELKELDEPAGRWGLTEAEVQQMKDDIQAGDEWLGRYGEVELPAGVRRRVEQAIEAGCRGRRRRWVVKAATVAAVLVVGLGLVVWQLERGADERAPVETAVGVVVGGGGDESLFANEYDLWEMAYMEDDYWEKETDDLELMEVLLLWDDVNWEIEKLFGKENYHEKVAVGIVDGMGTGSV